MTIEQTLPYWVTNLPREEWPEACPEFLLNVDPKDQEILGTLDEHYPVQSWDDVKHIVNLFQRIPSDLRRYLAFNWKLKQEYGSVMNFVLKERLHWTDITPRDPIPFRNPEDFKILRNDWPYGIDPDIVHLVVWTKFELEDDPTTDDLTMDARRQIDEFVQRTFCSKINPEHVIWFKNWKSLKSIRAVEHFHVMLYRPDPDFVQEITGGDVSMSQSTAQES